MLHAHRTTVVVLTACPLLLVAQPVPAQFEELAATVPGSANAITLLDAQKLPARLLAAAGQRLVGSTLNGLYAPSSTIPLPLKNWN